MRERFIVVDLETTSREPKEAHVVEWAAVIITPPWFGKNDIDFHGGLVRPLIPIPPETSAVHHIIDADVVEAPRWDRESMRLAVLFAEPGAIGVAHNADYERTVLRDLNLSEPWICTYKAALRIWPDAPGHSNEVLRYWLGLGTGRSHKQDPHSALHDAMVTSAILEHLLKAGADPQDMIKWADEPAMLPRCPLGVWRNHLWTDVEEGFLRWIISKINDRPDVVFCARKELERREEEYRRSRTAIAASTEVDDIPF